MSISSVIVSCGNAANSIFIFNVLYTILISVHFQYIENIFISKVAVYTPSRWYMSVDVFCTRCLTSSLTLQLASYYSSTNFKMLLKSTYIILEPKPLTDTELYKTSIFFFFLKILIST